MNAINLTTGKPVRWPKCPHSTDMNINWTTDMNINWTREKLRRFKRAYNKAVKSGEAVFHFDGHDFVLGFAKYLIEYLDQQFKK